MTAFFALKNIWARLLFSESFWTLIFFLKQFLETQWAPLSPNDAQQFLVSPNEPFLILAQKKNWATVSPHNNELFWGLKASMSPDKLFKAIWALVSPFEPHGAPRMFAMEKVWATVRQFLIKALLSFSEP